MNYDHPDPPDPSFDPTRQITPVEPRKPADQITDPFNTAEPSKPGPAIPIDSSALWREDERWYMKALLRIRDAAIEKVTDPALLRRIIGMLTEWALNKLATKVLK